MKYSIIVKPNAKEERVEDNGGRNFNVWVKEPARDGLANDAVIRAVACFLNVAKSRIHIVIGRKGKKKILEIK